MTYFTPSGKPLNQTRGLAAEVRAEFQLIRAGFAMLPMASAIQSGAINYSADTGMADAYVAAVGALVLAYSDGLTVLFKATNANTGAATVNVNALGVKSMVRPDGTALSAGDILAGQICQISYNATTGKFQLSSAAATSAAVAAAASAMAAAGSATNAATSEANAAASAATASSSVAFVDTNPVVKGSADATKQIRFEVDSLTTGTTRVITAPDKSGTLAMTSDITGLSGAAAGTIELLTGAAIASAATVNLDTATGNRVHITGTTTISAVTLTRGPRTVIFDGILTLTHHATSNNLPGAANITTAAGDRAIYESDGTTVYCVSYIKANGVSVVAPQGSALVLLGVVDLAGATTAEFNGLFSASYNEYIAIGSGISSAVRTFAIYLRVKIAGSLVTTSDHKWCGFNSTPTGTSTFGSVADTSLPIWSGVEYSSTASVPSIFHLSISDPLSTSLEKVFKWSVAGGDLGSPPVPLQGNGSGRATKTSALTGIQFAVAGGTWGAGKIRLYGVANA